MKYPVPSVFVAVIDQRGKILLHESPKPWSLPGARLPGGLSWLESAKQMMKAQSGLDVATLDLVGIYSDPKTNLETSSEGKTHWLKVLFLAHSFSGNSNLNWYAPGELPATLGSSDGVLISDAFAFKNKVFVR